MQSSILATMFTTTTYGTWLPGDMRGYVDHGRVLPGNPYLLQHAHAQLTQQPVYLTQAQQDQATQAMKDACQEFDYTLLAISIESWHMHCLIAGHTDDAARIIGRLKTRVRQSLNRGRIWTKGYDHRCCYTERDLENRYNYINQHPGQRNITF